MRIVQINSVCSIGSTGRLAEDISRQLSFNSIENYIFYGVAESTYEQAKNFSGKCNVVSHQIRTRLLGKHGFYSKSSTRRLVRDLRRIDPDIVHLHNLHGHYLNIEILFEYLKQHDKKVIWTLHDCWSFTGHCAHFDYIGCEKWKKGCFKCPQLLEYPKSLIFDRSTESYMDKKRIFNGLKDMTIVTPSNWLKGLVEESFLNDYPIETIYNGIDTDIFKYMESDIRSEYGIGNKTMILAVSNYWNNKKGYSHYLKLSEMLEDNEVLVMVGLDSEQLREIPGNIVGIERTESLEQLVKLYSSADIFLNLTLEEVFGLVNAESLSCETPVITFDTGGCGEVIDRCTGILVKRGDLDGIVKAIRSIENREIVFDGDACRERVLCNFDKRKMVSEYLKLYKSGDE